MSQESGLAEQHRPATSVLWTWAKRAVIVAIFALLSSPASFLLYILVFSIFIRDFLSGIVMMAVIGAGQADPGAEPGSPNYIMMLFLSGAPTALLAAIGLLLFDAHQRKVRARLWLVAIAASIVSLAVVIAADVSSTGFAGVLLYWTIFNALSVLPGFWGCHFLTKSGRSKLIDQR